MGQVWMAPPLPGLSQRERIIIEDGVRGFNFSVTSLRNQIESIIKRLSTCRLVDHCFTDKFKTASFKLSTIIVVQYSFYKHICMYNRVQFDSIVLWIAPKKIKNPGKSCCCLLQRFNCSAVTEPHQLHASCACYV
jgi:hypothetical protein